MLTAGGRILAAGVKFVLPQCTLCYCDLLLTSLSVPTHNFMLNEPLPKPTEILAGCVWLPRFIAKARRHAAGELKDDYLLAFCHPRGVDGRFLAHFDLEQEATLSAIVNCTDVQEVERWFKAQPSVTAERIAAWNELAPKIGSPGHPGERELKFILRRTYPNGIPPEALHSSFSAILFDEK